MLSCCCCRLRHRNVELFCCFFSLGVSLLYGSMCNIFVCVVHGQVCFWQIASEKNAFLLMHRKKSFDSDFFAVFFFKYTHTIVLTSFSAVYSRINCCCCCKRTWIIFSQQCSLCYYYYIATIY